MNAYIYGLKQITLFFISLSVVASCHGVSTLSPACYQLDAPPALAAAPDLDLSVLDEPHFLTGLLKEPWTVPASRASIDPI